MRRLSLTAAALVSTVALLTTTSMLALAAPVKVDFGTLKPQGGWKVGTVSQGDDQYCAMVGTYNKNVVAAFARNAQGMGSLALDFGDDMFTPGETYPVNLSTKGTSTRALEGRASNSRSLVVHVGQDGGFYDALSRNGSLNIDLPDASLRLELSKFSVNHKDLVACASQLNPFTPDAEPRQRLAEVNDARTSLADAGQQAAALEEKISGKVETLNTLEKKIEGEAQAEIERRENTIAALDDKAADVREQLSDIEPAAGERPSFGRKLLAAIGAGGKEDMTVPPSTGSASRDLEARELGLADARRAAEETEKALALKNEIAAIEAEKNAKAQATLAAFDERQKDVTEKAARLEKQRDAELAKLADAKAEEDKALRAKVVSKQAQIAAASETLAQEEAKLPEQLAKTQSAYEERIAKLEAERDQLKAQVDSVTAENEQLKTSAGQGNPEDRLQIAQLKKQLLELQTQRQAEVASAAAAQKELDQAREQIATLRQSSADEMARLVEVRRSLDGERTALAAQREEVARQQADSADIAHIKKVLEQKQAELEKVAVEQGAEAARLESEKQALSEASSLADAQKLVASEKEELLSLRGRVKTLETDLAEAQKKSAIANVALAAAPQTAAVADEASKAELARLKTENESLRNRLASFLSGKKTQENETTASAAASEAVPEVASAQSHQPSDLEKPIVVTQDIKKDDQPVAQAQAQPAQAGVSPVLAALMGQHAPVTTATKQEQVASAAVLNAQEPASGDKAGDQTARIVPGNDQRMPAVPAMAVESEPVDQSTAQNLSSSEVATQQNPAQEIVAKADVQQPASAQDKGVFGIFGRALGYQASQQPSAQTQNQAQNPTQNIVRVTQPQERQQQPQAQTQSQSQSMSASADISPAEGNRAAAFLENVMGYHRAPGAAPAAVPAPAVAAYTPSQPHPQRAVQTAAIDEVKNLTAIETAAGAPSLSASVAAPVAKAPPLQSVELASLLQGAGAGSVAVVLDASGSAHWSTQAFNGMYESQAAQQGQFDKQIKAYLARYEADCAGKLKVNKGALTKTATGAARVVDISCADQGNAYATSIAFAQQGDRFLAILHAGQPGSEGKARRISQGIVDGLKSAAGVTTASAARRAAVEPASVQTTVSPAERPRFRIEIDAPAQAPADLYDLPTTIVQ